MKKLSEKEKDAIKAARSTLVSDTDLNSARGHNESFEAYQIRRQKAKYNLRRRKSRNLAGSKYFPLGKSAIDRMTYAAAGGDNNSKVTRGRKYQFIPLKKAFDYLGELKRSRRYAKASAIQARRYTKVKASTE